MTTKISYAIAFLTGLGMIFLGVRFFLSPEVATAGFGIHFNAGGDYSFHHIKGIRDIFSGLVICAFVLMKERRVLGVTLLAGTIIPVNDMIVVLSKSNNSILPAMPHIIAIIICAISGIILLITRLKNRAPKAKGYIKVISSADTNKDSIIEFNIVPSEKTPWHYHTLFSETFEVLSGTLEFGHNNEIQQLNKCDIATIKPNEKHYFHNVSNDECLIKVTVSPGNKNFENALLISKGLAIDGLASDAGTPKKLSDLAIFVYLNNSRMVGLQKIAEPIFNFITRVAIKNGRLNELMQKYCNPEI
ncbi:DUF4267 domain-containing protein [Pedobacter cryoconitis]|uniref:Quercetin dioxygenase-like cupin family protein n=1 Tax=Pedobacter cryoconitis TaxID=188932 RepID=A0A327SBD9_9SPHI|nr:DUF4267 domain-containing protein [Pedobacter cryoconitis]RAJ26389.1 quercetin dioxygenase-like cupin family protein [Pedobacter cryoconitis]